MAAPLSEDEIRQITLNGANLVPRQIEHKDILHQEVARVSNLFDQLFSTLRTDITNQHRTAACNLLSNLIEKCSQSSESEFSLLLWQSKLFWRHAFSIYLDQHHALNVKPSRLLLTSLTSVLAKCQDKALCESEKAQMLELLVQHIVAPSENAPTRPAMLVLAHWLSKNMVHVEQLCNSFGRFSSLHDHATMAIKDVLAIVLTLAPYEEFAPAAGSLAALILQKAQSTDQNASLLVFGTQNTSLWSATVLDILKQKPRSLDNFRHFVFPEIFQYDRPSFIAFLDQLDIRSILGSSQNTPVSLPLPAAQCEETLFCALSVGNKLGLVKVADVGRDADNIELFIEKQVLYIPDVLLGDLLLRTSDAVRIAGLAMLTNTTTTTQPLSSGTMDALKKGLPFLHADADAGFRSELFSLIKHLMERIKSATANLAKPQSKAKANGSGHTSAQSQSKSGVGLDTVTAHRSFVEWYVSFLKAEMRPTASYQRHVSALRCIMIIAKSGVDPRIVIPIHSRSGGFAVSWPFELDVVDDEMTDLLTGLLLNAYDDVRSTAAEILNLTENVSQSQRKAISTPVLVNSLAQAQNMMMRSGRADHADGVAHLYSSLFRQCANLISDDERWWASRCQVLEYLVHTIEQTIQVANADIAQAVSRNPLHGLFTSLRYIVEKSGFYQTMSTNVDAFSHLQTLYKRLYHIFRQIWSCVHDTLCNDTTEGVAAEEPEEEEIGTKDVLSYSWRALKESSLLLRAIVKSCPLTSTDEALLSPEQLRQLGDLTFTQLAELRHRGAFSTVAQTFVVCCIRSNNSTDGVSSTLEDWYKRAILCIKNQTAINTRRSAGLPSLMIGIVVADSKGLLFGRAMSELTIEGTRPVDQTAETAGGLSQVHALNCIKDIFKNSKLGERSEAYVPQALGLAAKCLSSDTWAVRNSGLMLFRALMDRLVGTNEAYTDEVTHTQSRLSDDAITSLMKAVLQLLGPADVDVNQVKAEVVFPALQLLQRVQPPSNLAEEIQQSVLRLTSNRQWHVRDKAAKTYAVLVPAQNRASRIGELVRREARTQNEAHGLLLTARYLIGRHGKRFTTQDMDTLVQILQSRIDDLLYGSACPFTQAAFVDVQASFFYAAIQKQRYLFVPGTRWASTEDMNILLNLPRDHFAACSFLRQSLALSLIHEHALFTGPSKSNTSADLTARVDTFSLLATRDPDACTSALRETARLGATNHVYAAQTTELLVAVAAKLLHDDDVDIEVQDAAQEVLVSFFSQGAADDVKKTFLVNLRTSYLPSNAATPLFGDKRLILQGALLNLRAEDESLRNEPLARDFGAWVVQVHGALRVINPFDTRYAAVVATRQFSEEALAYLSSSDLDDSFLAFCLAVYDLCNDDDVEIRTFSAPVATKILNARSAKKHLDMVPLAANQGIAEFIAAAFGSSERAALSAISRATGNAVNGSFPDSIKQSLAEKNGAGPSLFAQEKQNLFIDETREAKLWSSIAARLQPTAFSFRLLMNLCTWVIDGLDVLIAETEARPDQPLGWSRKAEVFTLGMQILYAAELVLKLIKSGVEMPVDSRAVMKRLETLLSRGQENKINVLWLQTLREMLEQRA
ncbi:hypothetical protein AUEXF2481DRAFT_79436 [Aureobasidium subglaciale EXF-2481]|uniref:Uncharacterized protein n=1 Tax=Aureobasidium subglaciale (strain EXF-2481) TaxID=1043005 RepID=A0A074YCX4_AURSE|nr:uncharacterized protein AUEXF2481DRAFT_79436 [Aureobasidium subglaciale EXF-2481]KEQ95613.1 hypothetical protein AUEXF2481DRAFT_79436 [Aureobasidium subglaciale EXF-2481]